MHSAHCRRMHVRLAGNRPKRRCRKSDASSTTGSTRRHERSHLRTSPHGSSCPRALQVVLVVLVWHFCDMLTDDATWPPLRIGASRTAAGHIKAERVLDETAEFRDPRPTSNERAGIAVAIQSREELVRRAKEPPYCLLRRHLEPQGLSVCTNAYMFRLYEFHSTVFQLKFDSIGLKFDCISTRIRLTSTIFRLLFDCIQL